ncbi:MAG: hypothetical protein JRI23_22905 [Deltaproteobacteria bacterium]|nr:hypothetical protein [Deltaproteobacteria bacterium]MBW2534819.1 hypothetical protein [Deltaproteobacteria bacterium]
MPAPVPPAVPATVTPTLEDGRFNIGRRSSGKRKRRRGRAAEALAELQTPVEPGELAEPEMPDLPEPWDELEMLVRRKPAAKPPRLKRDLLIGAVVAVVGSIIIVAVNRRGEEPSTPAAANTATAASKPRASAVPQPRPQPTATVRTDAELRDHFQKLVAAKQHEDAIQALGELCERDWRLFFGPSARTAVLELLVAAAELQGTAADRPFELVAAKLDTLGPDLLFELYTTRGGTKAAARAAELLRDDKLRERGTPALRVAYDLRMAPNCDAVAIHLIPARQDGDQRAKTELERVHTCAEGTKCCMRGNERVAAVIRTLEVKLGSGTADSEDVEDDGPATPEPSAAPTVEPSAPPGSGKVPTAAVTATPAAPPTASPATTPADPGTTPSPPPGDELYD